CRISWTVVIEVHPRSKVLRTVARDLRRSFPGCGLIITANGFCSCAGTTAWSQHAGPATPSLPRCMNGGGAMRIAMVGTGYVGLVSGACLADFGHHVTCTDKNAQKIAALHRGEMPIYEPGLESLVRSNVRQGRLTFSTELAAPVSA